MSYATPDDMIARFDNKRLGQLVVDSGSPKSNTDLETDPTLQAALDDGAADIETAILVSNRYSVSTLQGLAALAIGPARSALIRLNCDLAYGYLMIRKGYSAQELESLAPSYRMALDKLEQLRMGERIFNLTVNGDNPPGDAGSNVQQVPFFTQTSTRRPLSHVHRIFGRRHV